MIAPIATAIPARHNPNGWRVDGEPFPIPHDRAGRIIVKPVWIVAWVHNAGEVEALCADAHGEVAVRPLAEVQIVPAWLARRPHPKPKVEPEVPA